MSRDIYYSGMFIPYLLGYKTGFSPLDLSYKTDLDFWDCFGREKNSVL